MHSYSCPLCAHPDRVPAHIQDLSSKAKKKQQQIFEATGNEPSNSKLAKSLGVPKAKLSRMWKAIKRPMSLDALLPDGSGWTVMDFAEVGKVLASCVLGMCPVQCAVQVRDRAPRRSGNVVQDLLTM